MKSLAKNSIFYTIYTVLNLIFPLVTSIYVSRVLLPIGVGKVAYAQSIASYFVILAGLGIPNYGLREIAKLRDNQEKKNKLFTELIIINTLSSLVAFSLYLVLIFCIKDYRCQLPLFLSVGLLILFNILNIDWLYQGEEEYVYIVIRSIIVKVSSIIAIIVFVRDSSDFVIYALISTLATAGNYIFNAVNARKYVKLDFKSLQLKQHLKPIFIMLAGIFLSNIYGKIDITMLGLFSTDDIIGYYSYGQKVVDLVVTICTSITAVFMPRLSYCYKNGKNEFMKLIEKGIDILSFLTIPMAMGLFIVAPEIIQIMFGEKFLQASLTVRVLSILILIKGYGNLLCYQLVICTGNEKERLPATCFGSLANVAFNWLLIPKWAEIGAAIASVVSEGIVNGYQLIRMKKKIGFKFNKKPLIQSLLSTFVMGIVCVLLKKIPCSIYLSTSITIMGGIFSYVMMNILMMNNTIYTCINMLKGNME